VCRPAGANAKLSRRDAGDVSDHLTLGSDDPGVSDKGLPDAGQSEGGDEQGSPELGRFMASNSARHVAAVLRRMIVGGELPDGVMLPRQEDLITQFGVSNQSLREALSMLEAEGLVTVQSGNRGGAIVHSPDSTTAALTIGLVLERRRTSLVDVGEAMGRVLFECAELCALAQDRAERVVPELERLNKRAMDLIDEPSDPFVDASLAFHTALADLSENQSLALVVGSLKVLWDSHALRVESVEGERFSRDDRRADVSAHEAVTAAIALGDTVKVRRILEAHMALALEFWSHVEGPSLIDVTSEGLEALRVAAMPPPEARES
jgi:GntR family transcriptional repressor for pyruvate dehydrogenase complex